MTTPWISLYPADFLADIGHLGNTELGIYWRLLLVYYRDGKPLPFDTDRLRRLAMCFSPEEFRALDSVVAEFFSLSTELDGTRCWRHKRADKELASAKEKHAAAAKKASAAAEARWSRARALGNAPSNATSMPRALPKQCQPQPQPQPQPENTKPPHPPAGGADRFAEFWEAWPSHKRKVAKAQCEAKWRARGCDGIADRVIAAVAAASRSEDWRKSGGEYIPAPLVWLNQARWEADAAETAKQPNPFAGVI